MRVETVRGAMAVDGLGTTLMHEHVFVLTPDVMQNYGHEWWWDEQDRGADAVRQLQPLKDAGVDSIVDPTVVAWAATDSVGYSVPSVDLGIVPLDEDPSTGELVVRGANVTAGYWQRPETNAETIVDGWLHTGDIVRVDDAGRVHIVDRIKDIVIRGGENVSSIEVESALLAAPGVAEAAVVAVPDDVMGEKVGAVLFGGAETVDVPRVLAHCREQLADFKTPQYVVVAGGPLPRNPGGKLLKAQLRESVEWGAPL
jgi:acyl-CoA synthetase (AMP-forming)/AMP-acid ligase II